MPLKLSVRVGQAVAIGGPTNVTVEAKSGNEVRLSFDADRSVPIRIVPDGNDSESTGAAQRPQAAPLGLNGRPEPEGPVSSLRPARK